MFLLSNFRAFLNNAQNNEIIQKPYHLYFVFFTCDIEVLGLVIYTYLLKCETATNPKLFDRCFCHFFVSLKWCIICFVSDTSYFNLVALMKREIYTEFKHGRWQFKM